MERNPSEGPLVHIIWGKAVDVLTREGTGGETRTPVRGVEGIAGSETVWST